MDLIKLLSDDYEQNRTMVELQGIVSEEVNRLKAGLYDSVDQCYPSTAESGLSRLEQIFGLPTDVTKSSRYRKEKLAARMTGAVTTRIEVIKWIAESYTGAEVTVAEDEDECLVSLCFVGTIGIPGNIADVKESIEEAIPGHFEVEYIYIYNTYGSVATMTHAELAEYTHYEIRNGRVRSSNQKLQSYQHVELHQLTHIQLTKGELPNGN